MKVILFGATGMVGQGVLRECLLDARVESVLTIGRTVTGQVSPKLRELAHPDLYDLGPIADDLRGYDACLFCLGISAAGQSEAAYRRLTYDLTLSAARTLVGLNPELRFLYVSGAGTNANGRAMWARVKGATENDLLTLSANAYMFRPGFIQPQHGITSRTALYRAAYVIGRPLFPVLRRLFPGVVTTTERMGRAMVAVAASGWPKRVLESNDINAAGDSPDRT